MVLLETRDGRIIRASLDLLERSLVMGEMCRVGEHSEDEDFLIPVHGIHSGVLLKILLWTQYHKGHKEPAWVSKNEPLSAEDIDIQTSDWDKEFLRVDIEHVLELMEGSNYLDIPWLYKLCAQKLAFYSQRNTVSQDSKYSKMIPLWQEFQALSNEQTVDLEDEKNTFDSFEIENLLT
ncbi:S-phase kinase-associated protein 1 [Drosophila biarmipes]|uniref:S-phase kinase-associated protein 1 n=1 Tax=Drosophila biarmipes TaxID=125945 RepID=UPI0007E6F2EC|nr:S-phase kinase-associated protein 1 [Drosophila biarmipes]